MSGLLVVSPHLDDAVLSVGQLMAGRTEVTVATVCSGVPRRHRMLTTYDEGCGFTSAAEAMAARRGEDRRALAVVGAEQVQLGMIDSQYRDGVANLPGPIADVLHGVVVEQKPDLLLGPLGLAHPDHVHVSEAVLQFVGRVPEVWLYEELPARVLWPELLPDRWQQLAGRGYQAERGFLGTGPLDAKAAALGCYASQQAALAAASEGAHPHTVLVPERVWRVDDHG